MAFTKPIPVRLEIGVIARLDMASRRMGTNRSALIKFLVQTFVESFESRGIGNLPHDWQSVMRQSDGRTFGQQFQSQSLRAAEEPHSAPAPAPVSGVKYPSKPKPKKS